MEKVYTYIDTVTSNQYGLFGADIPQAYVGSVKNAVIRNQAGNSYAVIVDFSGAPINHLTGMLFNYNGTARANTTDEVAITLICA